jgi:hypothetical protein
MKFKVPYYHDPKDIIFNSDFSINHKFFENLTPTSPVVLNLSLDPYNVKEINELLKSQGINTDNIIFLTSNYDLDSTYNNIIFYPSWLISTSLSLKKIPINLKRNYKISCLNRIAKGHRFYLFYLLKEKKYFNELVYTLQGLCSYDNNLTWDNGQIAGLDDLPKKVREKLLEKMGRGWTTETPPSFLEKLVENCIKSY